ncbi:response regulator [Aureimonas sp. ME7]|uniref:sensor histidine kinase n=1 Tax=Aureimonas sp. ME7 TaxID=2744252 RepID=UPI0015FB128A|nr:response regulator [Aureimonas sp. ME7]
MTPTPVLLVDDLEENLIALEALLRRDDHLLLKARSGDEALELLLRHDVALALVDVQMPGLNGFELAELMRGNERTRRIPIIFVTAGSADGRRRFQGYEAGAVDFIQKPIEPDILRSKVEVFFELYRQRLQIAQQRDELAAQAEALREAGRRKDLSLMTLAQDIALHEDARAYQDMVLREVNHRIKNLFSVTAGLISMSARSAGSIEELTSDLKSRLRALANVHDLTLPDLGQAHMPDAPVTTLIALLKAIVAPHDDADHSRISISGADVRLPGSVLTSLAMLFHELTTNASKYGALSTPEGRLRITVSQDNDVLCVDWQEEGVTPNFEPATRQGFGTTLEKAMLKGLDADIHRNWRTGGLSLVLTVPLDKLEVR